MDKIFEEIGKKLYDLLKKRKEEILLIDDVEGIGKININNFKEFKRKRFDGYIYAVDGGSAILLDGGSWILSKIRVGYVKFYKTKLVETHSDEYYYLIILMRKNDIDSYESFIFKKENDKLVRVEVEEPDWLKYTKIEGESFRRFFVAIPSHLMKLFEYKLLTDLVERIEENSLLIEDSLLYSPFEIGDKYLRYTEKLAKERGIHFIGISKTTRFRTDFGRSLGLLFEIGEEIMKDKLWYYYPLLEERKRNVIGEDLVSKLHELADRCFRIQICEDEEEKIREVLGYLAYLSSDPELIGYPFPLIIIDRFIRITNQEKEYESNLAKIIFKKLGIHYLIYDVKTQDFHQELDKRAHK